MNQFLISKIVDLRISRREFIMFASLVWLKTKIILLWWQPSCCENIETVINSLYSRPDDSVLTGELDFNLALYSTFAADYTINPRKNQSVPYPTKSGFVKYYGRKWTLFVNISIFPLQRSLCNVKQIFEISLLSQQHFIHHFLFQTDQITSVLHHCVKS